MEMKTEEGGRDSIFTWMWGLPALWLIAAKLEWGRHVCVSVYTLSHVSRLFGFSPGVVCVSACLQSCHQEKSHSNKGLCFSNLTKLAYSKQC